MMKISALNGESEEENDSELKISAEALLQIASQQYAKALDLQRKGKLAEATQLLKDLLDTELLYNVKLPESKEVPSGPLCNLKYLCYKNLAFMLQEAGDIEHAIEAYINASELDETDVTLWYRLGLLFLQAKQYERGLVAFQRGTLRNPRHWPCIDNIIKLLLGLNYKEQCISTIHDALHLDPGYLRGLVYRRHIYTINKHMRHYMEDLHPMYKWNEKDENPVDEKIANKLLEEAEEIYKSYIEQQKSENFVHVVPRLKLKKPIIKQTWECVGDSLVHMHHYMTEHYFSHACFIDIVNQTENAEESMEMCEEDSETKTVENKLKEVNTDNKKEIEAVKENEDLSDKDKTTSVNEKGESDIEMVASESAAENNMEDKSQKKNTVRRRGSALSSLNTWEWFTRSGPRKQDNIYDNLRKLVPLHLVPEIIQKNENVTKESSPDVSDVNKVSPDVSINKVDDLKDVKTNDDVDYFGTEAEQKDVKEFINSYTENSKDIIDMLYNYLEILSGKWNIRWSEKLSKIFVEANDCYNNHIDVPSCTNENTQNLIHYTFVNILAEELKVNIKLCEKTVKKTTHDLNVVASIDMIVTSKPHIFCSPSCLEIILRLLWVKLHVHIFLNNTEDFALEISYDLLREFEAMGDFLDTFSLNVVNFTFKPEINEKEIWSYIQMVERNKKLLSVMDLYNQGCYEDVISIITESFDECRNIAKNREHELPLNFAVQLTLVLESYWASEKVNSCFKWSFISLHESLSQFFHFTSGSDNYELWTLVIIKILNCMEHILNIEGLSCLEYLSPKDLSQGLEDLIRIIVHQVETNAFDMPFNTYAPCIIMHHILQREEDLGRGTSITDIDDVSCDEVPHPLMVLFLAHEYLGEKGWCCNSDGQLLYFILDTVVPRLRSPLLSKCLKNICQYMEQVVLCLYAHPSKINNKMKHLRDHKVPAKVLNWKKAQQIYEIFRPTEMPALEGKNAGISPETEILFHRILSLLPEECDPSKYISEIDKYLEGPDQKFISITPFFPFKMKDIYLFLGDLYFKKENHKKAIKYNILDVILNNDRFNSWAQISLSKVFLLGIILNKCEKINNDKEFLTPAKSAIRCYKRALQLNTRKYSVWVEYGNFVYDVHSFCSRLLKQDSESLSMEEFGALEKQKEDLLSESKKAYSEVVYAPDSSNDSEYTSEDRWFLFYMLGKVAEKRNDPPSVYLNFYMQGIKRLHETGATYPNKIIYKSPSQSSFKVLELHYRVHASILKYIEQHENKPIPALVGKVFVNCIEGWLQGPFSKKTKENIISNTPTLLKNEVEMETKCEEPHAANILKRSISDAGEEDTQEVKRLKIEAAAAKIRRSASYDTERFEPKEPPEPSTETKYKETKEDTVLNEILHNQSEAQSTLVKDKQDGNQELSLQDEAKENVDSKKDDSSTSSSSTSSSDSNSSDSSSNSSSDSSSDSSSKSSQDSKQLTDQEIMKIVGACLDALEDCVSRYPPYYKAIYRLAHYHFYYKKGRDIERCRDLMLSTFISRSGQKMCGLFSERKANNFFNNIWKLKANDIDRAGGFGFHMNRCVLLTMEILKEIDDHKTLLTLSLHLQVEPDSKKKYLRDSDREDLAQQAFSLCTQSLKGQLLRFSQQSDLKTNEVERNAFHRFMLDIYEDYQKVQRTPNSKHITTLLIDAYKLISTSPITENINLSDLSIKYCQSLYQSSKQQPMASIEKIQNIQKKRSSNYQSISNSVAKVAPVTPSQSKVEAKPSSNVNVSSTAGLPKISAQDMAAAFQSYVPMLNDITQQKAAAFSLSYLNNINALAGLTTLQNTMQSSLQTSLQNSYQAELYRQLLGTGFPSYYMPQQKKPKRGRPVGSTMSNSLKSSKSFTNTMSSLVRAVPLSSKSSSSMTSGSKSSSSAKATSASVTNLQKSTNSLTPSMGTVLSTLPASMTANVSAFGAHSSHTSGHSSAQQISGSASIHSKTSLYQQVSPSKTLQEKLAERQKNIPSNTKIAQDVYSSLNRLPSSLTITKNSVSKHPVQGKKPEAKKSLSFGESEARPKPITPDEVIVLDDD